MTEGEKRARWDQVKTGESVHGREGEWGVRRGGPSSLLTLILRGRVSPAPRTFQPTALSHPCALDRLLLRE